MKSLRYVVLLSLMALLLASCTGLPPVFPTEGSSAGAVRGTGATEATEPTVPPPAPVEQATTAVSETAVVTATIASPPATIAAAEVVTETAPAEAPAEAASTPTVEQVMGANPLTGAVWEWTALIKTSPAVQAVVPDPAAYTVTFGDGGNVLIKADCNNALGAYTLDNDALTITIGPLTRAACPPGSLSNLMLESLGKVGTYLIDGTDLILRTADTGESMLFRNGGLAAVPAAPPVTETPAGAAPVATEAPAQTPTPTPAAVAAPALVGTVWQWERFTDVATGQNNMDVPDPAQYTVTFMGDGTAAMKADCNQAAGTYTVDGARMTINVGPVTLAACGVESLSEAFLIDLTSVATYSIENGKLNLDLMADGGRMVLGAAQ